MHRIKPERLCLVLGREEMAQGGRSRDSEKITAFLLRPSPRLSGDLTPTRPGRNLETCKPGLNEQMIFTSHEGKPDFLLVAREVFQGKEQETE